MNKKLDEMLPKPPETVTEAARYERDIARLLRQIHKHEDTFNSEVERLEKKTAESVMPLLQQALGLSKSLYAFAKKNRKSLTQDETKKTVEIPGGGLLQWYATPAAVHLRKGLSNDELVAAIKRLELTDFIRTKEEPNKEAMIEQAELANTIEGVTVRPSEKFAIRPTGTEYRVEYSMSNKKWKLVSPKKEKPQTD